MRAADKAMLRNIREKAQSLADDLKRAHEAGYQVSVGMDGPRGLLALFEVKQVIPIDIDADLQ